MKSIADELRDSWVQIPHFTIHVTLHMSARVSVLLYLPYLSRETHLGLLGMTKWDLNVRCLKHQTGAVVINEMAREMSGVFIYSVTALQQYCLHVK